jgi:branched-chain amino acid transport system permease protein
MADALQYLVSGIAIGSVYALVALGFVVIYRASKVFNFAHGEFLTFGALMMALLYSPSVAPELMNQIGSPTLSGFGLPWGVALILTVVATGLLAAGIERIVLRPMVGRPVFVTIIITLFIGILLRTGMSLGWGNQPIPLSTPWPPMSGMDVGSAVLQYDKLAPIIAGALAMLGFYGLLKYTRLGVAMRATAVDQEACVAMGIPVGRIFGATWFIAGAIAGLGGVFIGSSSELGVDPNLGFIAFRAFPAVIVGGLESPLGAVIAGLLLGVLEVLTSAYINEPLGSFGTNFHMVLPYLVMIVVLIFKPYGLFGTRKVERL